jgi:hypothetical protein
MGIMELYNGPDIIEDGLVLALDAADFNSFKGEATVNLSPGSGNYLD